MITRFAIASMGRSGSTMLQNLLDSHPDARCLGEVVAPGRGWQQGHAHLSMDEYLKVFVYRDDCQAAGFKMMHEYVHDFPYCWDVLAGLGATLVINRRRNKVDQYLSMRLAQQNADWSSRTPYPATTLLIDPDDLLMYARSWTNVDAELAALAGRFPSVSVDYEDVIDGKGLEEVQRFLGLEPRVLSTPTVRARRQTRREVIENFNDVAAALGATPWAEDLFADE